MNSVKKITILLVIIFTFLFSTTSWGEWIYVDKNRCGFRYYYDKDILRKSGEYIYFLELMDYGKPLIGDLLHIVSVKLDFSSLRFRSLKFQSFDKSMGQGKMTDEWIIEPDKCTYLPETSPETLYHKICEEQ